MKNTRRIILTGVILLILLFCENVKATDEFRFLESQTLNMKGFFSTCESVDDKAYCFGTEDVRDSSSIYEIDLNKQTNTFLKKLTNKVMYNNIEKVDDGYLAVGLNVNKNSIVVTYFDNSFNIVSENSVRLSFYTTGFQILKIENNYYVLNQGINDDGEVAIQVSEDFSDIELIYEEDIEDNKYEKINVYNEIASNLTRDEILVNFHDFNNGYLVTYTHQELNNDTILFYKDGEVVWKKTQDKGYFGTIIVKDCYFYTSFEQTDEVNTSFVKYSADGEEISSRDISVLNDNGRFFLSNFILSEYNNKVMFFSYSPNETNYMLDWNEWRIVSLDISSKINKTSNVGGSIETNLESAFTGDKVQFTIDLFEGYKVKNIKVFDFYNNEIEVKDNSFIMPNSEVTISVEFEYEEVKNIEASNPNTLDIFNGLYVFVGFISILIFIKCYQEIKRVK